MYANLQELQDIERRKIKWMQDDSIPNPRTKYETYQAVYEGEVKKNLTDPAAVQEEDIAPTGMKLSYKGAHYHTGQPFLVEGDPKQQHLNDPNRVATRDKDEEKMDDFVGDRHRKKLAALQRNDGAHFDYKEAIKECFNVKTDLDISKYIASGGKGVGLPKDIGSLDGARKFLKK